MVRTLDLTETVDVHAAKTHLSRLLEAVERGEEFVIARAGRPVARLVPTGPAPVRVAGAWKGRVDISDDFDGPDDDIARWFLSGDEPSADR